MNKKLVLITAIVMIGITYIQISRFIDARKIRSYNRTYYHSSINGKMEYCKIVDDRVHFKIKNDPTEYAFLPKSNDLEESGTFCDVATKGDLIKKNSHSDTLRLIKLYKSYLFTSK